jgi:hypothetical protein
MGIGKLPNRFPKKPQSFSMKRLGLNWRNLENKNGGLPALLGLAEIRL